MRELFFKNKIGIHPGITKVKSYGKCLYTVKKTTSTEEVKYMYTHLWYIFTLLQYKPYIIYKTSPLINLKSQQISSCLPCCTILGESVGNKKKSQVNAYPNRLFHTNPLLSFFYLHLIFFKRVSVNSL